MFSNIKTQAERDAELLSAAKESAIKKINEAREVAIASGVLYGGNTYQSNSQSIADLNAVSTLSLINPSITVPWLTLDNVVVELSATQIQELAALFAVHKTTHVIDARTQKDLVNEALTIEEINLILGE